jgi:predicted AlkP superfamily pyrophosphatase or phosphodiesterase
MRVFKKETAPHTFKAASAAIEQSAPGDILVIIEELDRIGHLYGGSGSPYRTRARYILEESAGLVKKFIERNNDGIFALVSDHGMADVTTSLDIMNPVFGRFGLPGSVYLIYNDSVYLKVWCDNASLREDLFDFIKRHDGILSLDADMRAKYAINSQRFGDPVFVLKKGYVFSPNCFSLCIRGAPKGMHGYLEGDEDTSGILMTNLDLGKSADLPLMRLFDEFRIKSDREGP